MQQEEVDRKAIKARRGPGVHSSLYTPIQGCTVRIPDTLYHTHTHTHPLNPLFQLRSV